jgi:hypothetical protein
LATLREFVNEELSLDQVVIGEGEMVTDAVLIYRVVSVDDDGGMCERADHMVSTTCGRLLAKGLLGDVEEQWGMDYAERYFKDGDDDSDN